MSKKATVSELFLAFENSREILHEKIKAREDLKTEERQEPAEFRKEIEPLMKTIQTTGALLSLCDKEVEFSDSQFEILAYWLSR